MLVSPITTSDDTKQTLKKSRRNLIGFVEFLEKKTKNSHFASPQVFLNHKQKEIVKQTLNPEYKKLYNLNRVQRENQKNVLPTFILRHMKNPSFFALNFPQPQFFP